MNKIINRNMCVALMMCIMLLVGGGVFFAARAVAQNQSYTAMWIYVNGERVWYENRTITMLLDGVEISDLPMEPVLLNDRTFVAVRELFEAAGGVVDWRDETRHIYIGVGNDLALMQIGNYTIYVNGTAFEMDVAPMLINDKTMVPARFATEAFNFEVEWDYDTFTVLIWTQRQPNPTNPPTAPPEGGFIVTDVTTTPIVTQNHPQTRITDISATAEGLVITANSPISSINRFLLDDNRFVIDIENARMEAQSPITVNGRRYLQVVRSSQLVITPQPISRVVLDFIDSVDFSVALSADRRQIIVTFHSNWNDGGQNPLMRNYISDVSFSSGNGIDEITIEHSDANPVFSPFLLFEPYRFVIDMPYSDVAVELSLATEGENIAALRTAQFSPDVGRITAELVRPVFYNITTNDFTTVVQLSSTMREGFNIPNLNPPPTPQPTPPPTNVGVLQNVSLIPSQQMIVLARPASPLNINNIIRIDDYLNRRYTFTLPGDFTEHFGQGTQTFYSGAIRSINVGFRNGNTEIIVEGNGILAYFVTYDENNIYLRAVHPKEKYERIVILDPGHGGGDFGAGGRNGHHGLFEKELTLDITLRVIELLEADGTVKVYSTRLTDVNPTHLDRAAMANRYGDFFVSIHMNAFNGVVHGTETWWSSRQNANPNSITNNQAAQIMQQNMVSRLGLFDRGLRHSDLLIVLRETTIPAVLVEPAFMDNLANAERLHDPEFIQLIAESIFDGILEVFEVYTPAR